MKTSTHCTCQTETDLCSAGVLERPRYFPGEILTPAEMTLEQQYFRDKLRRHNRLIHGWGVVCGAAVCRVPEEPAGKAAAAALGRLSPDRPAPSQPTNQPANQPGGPLTPRAKPWVVRITPGYILGPYGDEILIDREVTLDLRTCGRTGVTGENGEPPDPWCADVFVQREPGPLHVAVRYKEILSRPVRVQPAGCGCDETQCEYSRWRDGYEICALDDCPASHVEPPDLDRLFQGPLPDCPACSPDPWVVLARVVVDADGAITELDNCSCRRIVVSLGDLWWRCTGDACALQLVEVEGGRQVEPGADFAVEIKAFGLPEAVVADLGEKVTVKNAVVSENGTRLRIEAKAEADAEPGPRSLEIRDAETGRVVAARRDALAIRAAGAEPGGPAAPAPASPTGEPSRPTRGKGKGGGK